MQGNPAASAESQQQEGFKEAYGNTTGTKTTVYSEKPI